ncbi:MAG: type 1 glutamine amidotransferase-like domain-containing protein, partial [Candidatus Magasanikbacteria bacterium]|nr:type 1 glutamine amidotransferase-like domain-containing protein [Candidatus Magasanikbacteria bacterium]
TAGKVYENVPWQDNDKKSLISLGYTLTEIDLRDYTPTQLSSVLAPFDMVFVAGGNTTYLYHYAHTSGFIPLVKELLRTTDTLYVGSSAGSLLAGPSVEPFVAEDTLELPSSFVLADTTGIGLVDYIVFPHHPQFESSDRTDRETYGDRFSFVSLTDDEYRVATYL